MAWRFRKSFSPIPGVRLTLSPSGITTSVGVGPIRLTSGTSGTNLTARIPGTGLSFQNALGTGTPGARPSHLTGGVPSVPDCHPQPMPARAMQQIRSAESSALTSQGLAAFKHALEDAERQFNQTSLALDGAKRAESEAVGLHQRWKTGWVMKHLRKARFAQIALAAEESQALCEELQQQLELSRLPTQFDMSDETARAYSELRDAFTRLTRSQRIWDNVAHRASDRVAERTTASRIVDLKPVRFELDKCGVIAAPMTAPRMTNANGGDIYFYPGFLIYHASATNYALVEFSELDLTVRRSRFHEEATPPTDAEQVGTTWAKANKDGSPDLRFKDNYAIPVMQYATITLKTPAGLNEEYMVSNVEAAELFAAAWNQARAAQYR